MSRRRELELAIASSNFEEAAADAVMALRLFSDAMKAANAATHGKLFQELQRSENGSL